MLVVGPVELVPDLVEDREAVVEEVVEHVVEEMTGPACEERARGARTVRARWSSAVTGRSSTVGSVMRRSAPKDVELAGVQAVDRLVVDGEVEDGEEVASPSSV